MYANIVGPPVKCPTRWMPRWRLSLAEFALSFSPSFINTDREPQCDIEHLGKASNMKKESPKLTNRRKKLRGNRKIWEKKTYQKNLTKILKGREDIVHRSQE